MTYVKPDLAKMYLDHMKYIHATLLREVANCSDGRYMAREEVFSACLKDLMSNIILLEKEIEQWLRMQTNMTA
jgi:hypothetical protein